MRDRVIDVGEIGAWLHVENGLLSIEDRDQGQLAAVPLKDVAAVVLSHPRAGISHGALTGLAQAGAVLVVCDEKRLPAAMTLPLVGHTTQTERMVLQAQASLPTHKRCWQQVVRAKIAAQSEHLRARGPEDAGLGEMISRVRSGDPDNIEGQAARRYWGALFGPDFRRDPTAEDANRLLNYGYAVLRAIVARAIVGAGLHPSLGMHHHNRYDAFCLADDLMEPFRPHVDRIVTSLVADLGPDVPLDSATRGRLLSIAQTRFVLDGAQRSLFDTVARVAQSYLGVLAGERPELSLPDP